MENISQNTSPPKLIWVNFLRTLGSFLVVLAHTLAHTRGWGPYWITAFYDTLSRNAVPLFFMISGFLLLSKQEDVVTFLKKRAWKILIPFFAWSILYDVYWNQELSKGINVTSLARLLIRVLRGTRAFHLWFLYVLIGLYLFTPILRIFVKQAQSIDFLYFIGLWLIVVPGFAIIQYFTPFTFGFELQFVTGYVGYYILGLYLGKMEFSKKALIFFSALFILGFLFTFLVLFLDIPPRGSVNEIVFRSYLSINIIVMTAASYVLLKFIGGKITGFLPILDVLSKASFGIFLVHPIVLRWMQQGWETLDFSVGTNSSLWTIPLAALIAYLASFILIITLKKIPLIKYIVP